MTEDPMFPVPPGVARAAWIDLERYRALYARSLADPDAFWAEQAREHVTWIAPWTRTSDCDLAQGRIRWFEGGVLNACANCIDRHLPGRADHVAIRWEGDDPADGETITYAELGRRVGRCANALKARGVKKGDRVCIYMPMIPAAAVAMLACARIGAVHSVVFGGFSAEALKDRILDADARVLITADEGLRGGKTVPLKANADVALAQCPLVHTALVYRRTGGPVTMAPRRDVWWHELVDGSPAECAAEPMGAEDPLFILYTSGSTGKPKGVLHTTGGYMVYAAMTHRIVFDYHDGDIYWCTADVGWVTGHTYIVYGPLANGATTVMFEGIPTHPTPSRFWEVVDRLKVSIFYTAPTAIRSLMRFGDAPVAATSRSSLRLLGTVGEPINPEAWMWYHRVVGDARCPIVDTWWQTETGGILISPLPGATATKPGSATLPLFGIEPAIYGDDGLEIHGAGAGRLAIKRSWPGQLRTVWGNPERFMNGYLRPIPGTYFTGDGARRDADGYWWITGRIDDVINVAGHRLGTAEIESALVLHPKVAEAAVVGVAHAIKGQGIYAFVTPVAGAVADAALERELNAMVRREIGAFAAPDAIQFAPGLPKTRSGKIMRRILRKIAEHDLGDLGDTSTLADPGVVDELVAGRRARGGT